ncbi:MAG: rhomboid family intramembrane serine protease [Gammaproteobacteria bacterium]
MIPLRDDNPAALTPLVTVALIGACTLTFLWQSSLGSEAYQQAVYGLGFIPALFFTDIELAPELVMAPTWFTVFSSMFLHGGFMHLIGNMLYLWIFGNNVEDSMGHRRFVVFYLACGVIAALGQSMLNPESKIPMIGASGAISGVLGAYILLFPRAQVEVLIPFGLILQRMRLPAFWVLGLWFGMQLLNSALTSADQGGVAFVAHASGFVAGMALIPFFKYPQVRLYRPTGNRRY